MYLIVGLGNPEPEYSKTRHNMGFDVINKLSEKYNIEVNKKGFKSIYGSGLIENNKIILCKPQTYMNLSGDAVYDISSYYKINPENILVIYDDIDIKTGTIRLRKKGSAGSHNGMKSVIKMLQTEEFPRIRVGTGLFNNHEDLVSYVINKVSKEEYGNLQKGINLATNAVTEVLQNGIEIAMNKYNKIGE